MADAPNDEPRRAELSDDAIVIRFTPKTPEGVWRRAELEERRIGRRRLSVFAAEIKKGETEEMALRRLLDASELQGIAPENNPKYFVCTRASKLSSQGFTFWKDGGDEVEEHYSVDLGDEATPQDAERFLQAFDDVARRRSE
jgi:hypothetical protein